MEFKFNQLTSPGDRQTNQDCMWHVIGRESALFVVADGLGGHLSGEKASVFFCKGIAKFSKVYLKLMARYPLEAMFSWINEAIKEMRSLFDGDPSAFDAYTTCAILYRQTSRGEELASSSLFFPLFFPPFFPLFFPLFSRFRRKRQI